MWIIVSVAFLAFLALHVLLGYARPPGGAWLIGSVVLFVAWAVVFMRMITAESRSENK